ncbi:MAG TPA: metallophosphoesterase [Myxococcaceae bacterium]|nr:metallophosphoesterase [Myxococcaceae bacterium]
MAHPRTLLIGDVHGCLDELRALLRVAALSAEDRVVLLGDLVAKGPDSLGVVQFVREQGFQAVLGNHEAHVLRAWDGEHAEIQQGLGEDGLGWLNTLPLSLRIPEHNVIAVHAGLVPGIALEAQSRENVLTMRSLRSDGTASKRVHEGEPWSQRWEGPEHVVFGHDAIRGLQRRPFATGLDTGCAYGRQLTALLLPEWELISVPAKRAYISVGD